MRELGIPGMHLVRRLLEAEAGGGLADADEMTWAPAAILLAAGAGARGRR